MTYPHDDDQPLEYRIGRHERRFPWLIATIVVLLIGAVVWAL